MSAVEKIIIAFVLLQTVLGLFKRLMGTTQPKGGAAPVPSADPAAEVAAIATQLAGLRPSLDALTRRGDALAGAFDAVGGPAAVLRHVLDDDLRPRLARARAAIDGILAAAQGDDPAALLARIRERAAINVHLSDLRWIERAFGALEQQARWRGDPALREVLADADAISRAFLRPLLDFLGVHGLRFKEGAPISAPGTGAEAVWFDLLPHHPVVQVPDDFDAELLRWPAVAHEVAHIMFRDVPGLGAELRAMVPAASGAGLARISGRSVRFDLAAAFAGWVEEIFADAVCMMLLGPSALRGMVASFQAPRSPQQAVTLAVAPGGTQIDEHPPAHLRVLLAGWFLERMGYLVEPEALVRGWSRLHGEPTDLLVPTLDRTQVPVPLVRFRVFGQQLLEQFYTSTYHALAGYPLSAINGLEMSPGLWARAEERAQALLDGVPFRDDPRVVIAAAIEAAASSPGAQTRIARGVRTAIAGIGTHEGPVRDVHYDPLAVGPAGLNAGDLRDVVILGAMLQRPSGAR